ncbi:MAG TPA: hypothetical protein VMZ03_10565, partial [Chitinophagaceae bacterium]|nr:hypothetical protein [Chitinophagaceae bacterium]
MEATTTLQKLIPVKADYPITSKMDRSIEMRDLSNSWVIQANFSARFRPTKEFPQVVTVPHGYGFYWLKAYNAGWTDNIDAQGPGEYPRPLQGFDFENKHQYIYAARRAQLVAIAGDSWVGYELVVDESQGGTQ